MWSSRTSSSTSGGSTSDTIVDIPARSLILVAVLAAAASPGGAVAAPAHRAAARRAVSPDREAAALGQHVATYARLVGKPAKQLVDRLGRAAVVGDGMIEWNLADLGITTGGTYGHATVVHGKITGMLFRGRASLETLRHLKLPRTLQLTEAGGDHPSFSIVVGE